ncbi:pre-mRNA 3'-end-processing factor FIP1 isoform X2 [Betta splendens]|uniref:Pre-mRNA 3'-end-processing factor FIP1 isoform X2 n=1 Tax=Betta splendens TaxID=158456 RepID=A0A9W2XPN4_BETSP|nr:pre-mRNA 3'-end-processing factor FIP1 isoform X2 [Betta splendens]
MYSESRSKVVAQVDEEEKIYQFIYGMYTRRDREVEESLNTQPPPSISSEDSPVYVKNIAERRFHPVVRNTKGPSMDALDDDQEMPVEIVKSTEEKPWRESGADISDYFNYGFDEESWETYCKKQTNLCAAHAKLTVQKGQSKHEENGLCWAIAPSDWPSRESSPGVRHRSGRMGHQRLGDKGNNTQVIAETSSIEHRSTSSSVRCLMYVPSPSFLCQRRHRPHSSVSTLNTKQAEESPKLSSSVSQVARTVTSSAAVTYTDKGRRSRAHGHNQTSKRGREGQVWSGSSRRRGDKQTSHRETRKPGHRHRFKERRRGDSRGKEERHRKTKPALAGARSKVGGVMVRTSQNRRDREIPRDAEKGKERADNLL